MAIKFLQNYETKATPSEKFTLGQVVKDRDEASETRFVIRGIAAFLRDGKLFNAKGDQIEDPAPSKPEKAEKAPDYTKDKLGQLALDKATEAQLRVIAEHEKAELPKGPDSTVEELIAAIEAKRKPA
ncbi:hypothetical protein [Rhizorhabdus sp.]|uniref:hypothetical protein n=1 Tax=Rhizorhabdus sp. TaxID=1968843 RepID=UPI0019C12CAA|nr:hypothetical protein [Rhizorhabdus sp.]MBD3762461.1 hypothetical protein [Rhizorhabdus sp.]